METLQHVLFEDPLYLYIALAVAEVVLFLKWRQRRDPHVAWAFLLPVVLAAGAFATARLVVTDRERITAASRDIAAAIRNGRIDLIAEYLDDNLVGAYPSKQQALEEARKAVEQYRFRLVELRGVSIKVTGRRAEMTVTTVIEPGRGDLIGQRFALDWIVHWSKVTAGGRQVWRITSVTRPDGQGVGVTY